MKLSKLFIVLLLTVGCFKTKRSSFDPSTPVGTLNALFRVLNSSSDYELEPVLTYSSSSYTYYTRIEFETPATVSNVKSCSVSPSLPAGIILDTTNCKISGTPTSASSAVNYTVTAKNITKTKTAVLSISVEKIYTVFVTSSFTNGSFTDSVCSSDFNKPTFGTYKAMIVRSTRRACSTANCSGGASENLDWVFRPSARYYKDTSSLFIKFVLETDSSGIFTSISTPFSNSSNKVWTGLNSNFTTSANTCSNWTNNTGGFQGSYGFSDSTASQAYSGFTQTCDNSGVVVCVEQ